MKNKRTVYFHAADGWVHSVAFQRSSTVASRVAPETRLVSAALSSPLRPCSAVTAVSATFIHRDVMIFVVI